MSEVDVLFASLRQAADPQTVECIEKVVMHGSDRELNRINALAFADKHHLDEEKTIAAFLQLGSRQLQAYRFLLGSSRVMIPILASSAVGSAHGDLSNERSGRPFCLPATGG